MNYIIYVFIVAADIRTLYYNCYKIQYLIDNFMDYCIAGYFP